jgi:uncharacterized RmlC-like cupin family protein
MQAGRMTAVAAVVIVSGLALDPGVMSARHRHPGEEIICVLERAPLEYEVEGKPPVTLKLGDVLFIPAGTTLRGEERRQPKGAELATYIVEKGKSLLTEVSDLASK